MSAPTVRELGVKVDLEVEINDVVRSVVQRYIECGQASTVDTIALALNCSVRHVEQCLHGALDGAPLLIARSYRATYPATSMWAYEPSKIYLAYLLRDAGVFKRWTPSLDTEGETRD